MIEWIKDIKNKSQKTFIQLDIVEFYPSISEELLNKAFKFAEDQGLPFTTQQKEIIRNARKSLLYARPTGTGESKPWQKVNGDFDVTMGAPDGAEVCELVGLYILHEMAINFPQINFGLYRDDGLGEHSDIPKREEEQLKKELHKFFREKFGLRITVEKGEKQVNMLDVNLDLKTEDFKPYKKPNDKPIYVNTGSNHPATIIKQIPIGINKRLSAISSNENNFNKAKPIYQKALDNSGHKHELKYQPPENKDNEKEKKKKENKRKIIWFNPPFSLGVRTNIGKKFLALVDKHFPKKHPLRSICNRNTMKISYSCSKNLKAIIQAHNQKILSENTQPQTEEKKCNCQKNRKNKCPLNGHCVQANVIYQATTTERHPKKYIGSTENFKKRYQSHTFSFRHESNSHATTLSQHIWDRNLGQEPELKWEILDKAMPYRKGGRYCGLCTTEKIHIMRNMQNPQYLNRRTEISQKCRHRAKFRLKNYK